MTDANRIDGDRRDAPLGPGTAVEVRNRFNGRWTPGFSIDQIRRGGYRLRRSHDRVILPAVFAPEIVRPER